MHIRYLKNLRFGLLCLMTATTLMSCAESTQPGDYDAANMRLIQAVESFAVRLSEAQREMLFYEEKDDPRVQTGWSHNVVARYRRNGLALGDLNQEQRAAALQVIRTALGEAGYQQFSEVVASHQYLKEIGFSAEVTEYDYYLAIFGTPAVNQPWLLQISGHRYTQHIAFGTDVVAATPVFISSLPNAFQHNGNTMMPMRNKVEAMQMLLSSLSREQVTAAELHNKYGHVVAGSGDYQKFSDDADQGLSVQYLTEPQRVLLLAAIMQWVDGVNTELSYLLSQRYQAQSEAIRIGWSNSTDLREKYAYVRIQGPGLWIELSAQKQDDFPHVYYDSVYRDKMYDYGDIKQ